MLSGLIGSCEESAKEEDIAKRLSLMTKQTTIYRTDKSQRPYFGNTKKIARLSSKSCSQFDARLACALVVCERLRYLLNSLPICGKISESVAGQFDEFKSFVHVIGI